MHTSTNNSHGTAASVSGSAMPGKRLHYSENFSEEAADFTLLSLPEPLLAKLVEQDGCASIAV